MIRWTFSGVIKEGMLGIPPSSEPVNITGIGIFRITCVCLTITHQHLVYQTCLD
jgi:hypothetical protein